MTRTPTEMLGFFVIYFNNYKVVFLVKILFRTGLGCITCEAISVCCFPDVPLVPDVPHVPIEVPHVPQVPDVPIEVPQVPQVPVALQIIGFCFAYITH